MYDESGAAVKYVVAEHPWLEDGDLRWASGEYLNFCHYFTSGEALLGAARVMHQTCLSNDHQEERAYEMANDRES